MRGEKEEDTIGVILMVDIHLLIIGTMRVLGKIGI